MKPSTAPHQEPCPSHDRFAVWSERLKASDPDACRDVFQAMRVPLVRYARRITHDDASAYDVLQDVFMKLWDIRATLDPASSLKSLLYTMVRNRALNEKRRVERAGLVPLSNHDEDPPAVQPTPDQVVAADELAAQMQAWIEALPDRRREAFVLSRYHGLSYAEIGDLMGLSVRTVGTHVMHALNDLRARLEAFRYDERPDNYSEEKEKRSL